MKKPYGWQRRAEHYLNQVLDEYRHDVANRLILHDAGCELYDAAAELVALCGWAVEKWLEHYLGQ